MNSPKPKKSRILSFLIALFLLMLILAIVNLGSLFLGTPFLWGGKDGPSAFLSQTGLFSFLDPNGKISQTFQKLFPEDLSIGESGQGAGGELPLSPSAPIDIMKAPDYATFAPIKVLAPLQFPVEHYTVSSSFGWRYHPVNGFLSFHTGVDLAGNQGEPILSICSGIVEKAGVDPSLGNFVKLRHSEQFYSLYGHMSTLSVKVGDTVQKGQLLGTMGSTGVSTGNHLHFEIQLNKIAADPCWIFGEQLSSE